MAISIMHWAGVSVWQFTVVCVEVAFFSVRLRCRISYRKLGMIYIKVLVSHSYLELNNRIPDQFLVKFYLSPLLSVLLLLHCIRV